MSGTGRSGRSRSRWFRPRWSRAWWPTESPRPLGSRRAWSSRRSGDHFVEVLGEHSAPGGPLVVALGAPVVDAVWDSLGAQGVGHPPGFADVFPFAFAGGEDDPALPEPVQLRALQAGEELKRRGEVQVMVPGPAVEVLDLIGTAHADGGAEDVGVAAQRGHRVERADRRACGDDVEGLAAEVGVDGRYHLPPDALVELVEQPQAVLHRGRLGHHRLAGHAVDGVQLDPALGQQRAARVYQAVPLDLLGVAAGRGEDQHGPAVQAPPNHGDLLLQPFGKPLFPDPEVVSHRTRYLLWGSGGALTRRRTSADRGRSRTGRPAAGRASSPSCARRAPRRSGRPSRRPRTPGPWTGSGRSAARRLRS